MSVTGGRMRSGLDRIAMLSPPAGLFLLVLAGAVIALLVVLAALEGVSLRGLHVPWLTAVAVGSVGWVLLSGGTAGPEALANARRRCPVMTTAVLSASVAAVLMAVVLDQVMSRVSSRSVGVFAVVLATAVAALLPTRREGGGPYAQRLSPRTLPNLLIVTLLATTAATVGLALPDVFPLSRYPMFASPRYDPYSIGRVRFLVGEGEERGRELRAPASRTVLVEIADAGDDEALRALASDVAAASGVAAASAVVEEARLLPYPAPPVTGFTTVRKVTGRADDS